MAFIYALGIFSSVYFWITVMVDCYILYVIALFYIVIMWCFIY